MQFSLLAHELSLTGARGVVFEQVTVAARPGDVVAVIGPTGSGRTALLLTLTGRFAIDRGSLVLLGHRVVSGLRGTRQRRFVLNHSAIVHVAGVTDLDDTLTVAEVVGERMALLSRLTERLPRLDDDFIADLWGENPHSAAPSAERYLWQLSAADRFFLQLRLAELAEPQLIAVDDLDDVADHGARAAIIQALAAAAASGVTVVVSAHAVSDLADLPVDHIVTPRAAALASEVN